jgi:hypothetical protein
LPPFENASSKLTCFPLSFNTTVAS